MDARLIALGTAGLIGLVAGGGFWALSGGQAQGEALAALDTRLARISTRSRPHLDRPSDALSQALATPLFSASAQPPAGQADVAVLVYGLAKSPVRTAALLGIAGAPAEWLSVGESRGGVTLRSVSGSSAVVATPLGEREVMLGSPGASPAGPASVASAGGPPVGFKSPPPPASAPGMP